MPRGGQNAIPEADLIDALRRLADDLGRSPSQADINEHSPHSHKTYYRKFDGGLAEAKERAGLEHYTAPADVEPVEVECANCGDTQQRPPSDVEAKSRVYCSNRCKWDDQRERYRGDGNPVWNSIDCKCDHCGDVDTKPRWEVRRYDHNFCSPQCYGNWRSEELVGREHNRWKEYPTIECEWCGKLQAVKPAVEDSRRFCGGKCANKWKSEAYTGENNPHWRGGRVPYYGANWLRRRRGAIARDQARCQDCGMTESKFMSQYGEGLSVHHKTPIRDFRYDGTEKVDYHRANALDNLVSLCRPCHISREKSL